MIGVTGDTGGRSFYKVSYEDDRLHGHLGLSFGDHDSQIAVTLRAGALKVLGHSVLSLAQAFVHHEPRNFQPEPFRQFFDAHGEPLKPKAPDLHD